MGYEGVTVLHHDRLLEHGKDIVFHERENLGGGFTIYAVVACVGNIHSNSSKATDSAHYRKILDQVHKCFEIPFTDHNLKADLYVDKVIVACSGRIGDGAMALLRAWEGQHRRRLIFLDAQKIAGHKLRLHAKDNERLDQTEEFEVMATHISNYLAAKNLPRVGFERIRKEINPKYSDELLMEMIDRFSNRFRRILLKSGKPSVGEVVP
jgi:hypothetical protein